MTHVDHLTLIIKYKVNFSELFTLYRPFCSHFITKNIVLLQKKMLYEFLTENFIRFILQRNLFFLFNNCIIILHVFVLFMIYLFVVVNI